MKIVLSYFIQLLFFFLQVLLNQVILGPSVIAVIFAWSKLWEGKLAELPNKYKKDALPTLFTGKILVVGSVGNAMESNSNLSSSLEYLDSEDRSTNLISIE